MTKDEIHTFCANLEKSMLDVLERHIPICLSMKYDTEKIQWNDISPIDYVYHGQVIKIKFGRPASLQLAKDEVKRIRFQTKPLSPEFDPKEYDGTRICPRCGCLCDRDEVDIGVGIQYGFWFCQDCGWDEEHNRQLADKQSYDDLSASGGIGDAP